MNMHKKNNRSEDNKKLSDEIDHAVHLLPCQGPITVFVHHNTLHAFEDLNFDEAVKKGRKIFNCHPYLPEEKYREKLLNGRIRKKDLESALIDDLGDEADQLISFLGTRFYLRLAMLQYPLQTGPSSELRWVVAETDALRQFRNEISPENRERIIESTKRWILRDLLNGKSSLAENERVSQVLKKLFRNFDKTSINRWSEQEWEAFSLHLLWYVCHDGVKDLPENSIPAEKRIRIRDHILLRTGQDSDRLVNDVLIRFCSAFLDQGFANWILPNRDKGFYQSFFSLYLKSFNVPDAWLSSLKKELKRLDQLKYSPLESIQESLKLLGVQKEDRQDYVNETLLALRGWAGMIWQMESNAEWTEHPAPSGTIVEYLAIRLILERQSLQYLAKTVLKFDKPLDELSGILSEKKITQDYHSPEQRAFLVMQLAQIRGWTPEDLYKYPKEDWSILVRELEAFTSLERRRIYQVAFERHYRNNTLDAVLIHSKKRMDSVPEQSGIPFFQAAFCIDDREESFRRHLEEIAPECETFGIAGFFGAAVYYKGITDAYYKPLCPVSIKPVHYIREEVLYTFEDQSERLEKTRRVIGSATHHTHMGTRTFVGGFLTGIFGSLAVFPLVARILFPRLTAQLHKVFRRIVTPVITELRIERTEEEPGSENGSIGYSVDEMANVVEGSLRLMGLIDNFSPIVIFFGHGSSSLNNPHESAYNCGACSGSRGGPNARVFVQMVNDPRVRQKLADNGLVIPFETSFVSAYHNTCDDSITWHDLERIPIIKRDLFRQIKKSIDLTRARNAHERCRRFESAPVDMAVGEALEHVETRAEDLSQARPEYNHATNALCFVGRREWNRGLFLDRRAFLASYDPFQDDESGSILEKLLQAAVPVCAGINLEYYHSTVDVEGYGCGSKLPHNITSLLGVMTGAESDLRPGLSAQMVEIHEPVRILFVIETTPQIFLKIMDQNEGIDKLVRNEWIQVAIFNVEKSTMHLFVKGQFELYSPETSELPDLGSSAEWYRGWRDHLGFASIQEQMEGASHGL